LHIDSNSRSKLILFDDEKRLRAMQHSGESIFFFEIMANFKFYFTAGGQAISPMTNFLLDCYFNGFCDG
jgi:hypothetical protein